MEPWDLFRTLVAAMTPVGELRLSIPLAVDSFDMPWYQALPVSLVGNFLPVLVLVPGLTRAARLLRSFRNPAGALFDWWVRRVERSFSKSFKKYGPAALVLLVAIPLPMTGAWTGSVASWVFQIPPRTAIPLIAVGILIAGVVVTLLTEAGIHISLLLREE